MESVGLSLLLYAAVSYLLTYSIGHILTSIVRFPDRTVFLKEFTKVCTGLFAIITGYSILMTRGITINLGVLLLFILTFFWLKKNNYLRSTSQIRESLRLRPVLPYVFLQLLFLCIAFFILYIKVKHPLTGELYKAYSDFYCYSRNIQFLNQTGIESYYLDTYNGLAVPRALYHFGELWYTSFYSALLGKTAFLTFYFQLFPHTLTFYFLGACALIETFIQPRNNRMYLLAFAVLFICGVSFYIPRTTIFTAGDWYDAGLLYQPKYLFSCILSFYFLILIKREKVFPLLVVAMAVVLVNTVVAPAVLMTAGLCLLLLFVSKKISFRELTAYCVLIASVLLYIGIYTLFIHALNEKNGSVVKGVLQSGGSFDFAGYLKTAFNCFAGAAIKSILSMAGFLLPFFLFVYKKRKQEANIDAVLLAVFVFHIASITSYAIFYNRVDAVQLWTNIYIPFSAVVCLLLLAFIFESGNVGLKIYGALLVAAALFQSRIIKTGAPIDAGFLAAVERQYDGSTLVFFKEKADFSSIYSKNINLYAPAPYLLTNFGKYNPVCLSVFEIPRSDDPILHATEDEIIRNSVFFRFVRQQKQQNRFVSVQQSQIDFLKKYEVKFAVVYPNAHLPGYLQPLVKSVIREQDEGLLFYTLKAMP